MTLSTKYPTNPVASQRHVIINVDDLGLSNAVNEAVIALGGMRHIRSTSYMAGGEISDSQIRSLTALDIDIGLHLDFTAIYPSSIKNSLSAIIIASYLRRLKRHEIIDIIHRQLDGFEDRFNQHPVFIDGHQHVHQFPVVRDCLATVLKDRYAVSNRAQPYVAARITTPLVNDMKSWIIYILGGHAWQQLCQHSGIHTNLCFGGAYDFDANQDKLAKLWDGWLSRCPKSTEVKNNDATITHRTRLPLIMCHPAIPDNSWQDEIKDAREQEYQWLISDAFAALCKKYAVRSVGW